MYEGHSLQQIRTARNTRDGRHHLESLRVEFGSLMAGGSSNGRWSSIFLWVAEWIL
ncbi:hypothetical protein IC582_028564 [Cucumis melo]